MQTYIVAELLGRTAQEVEETMSTKELLRWMAFLKIRNEEEEKARKKAEQEARSKQNM